MATAKAKIALVGNPNVGKSAIFNILTGVYTSVSNYPGTTVDIFRGRCRIGGREYEVIDTPGMYSLLPLTEEERIARRLLFREQPEVVLHVVDAKNLNRMLCLTLEMLAAGLPLILVLNIMDEAEKLGLVINTAKLSFILGIPVVAMAAAQRRGVAALKEAIAARRINGTADHKILLSWPGPIQEGIAAVSRRLTREYGGMTPTTAAALLLQGDDELWRIAEQEPDYQEIKELVNILQANYNDPLSFVMAVQRQQTVRDIVQAVVKRRGTIRRRTIPDILGDLCIKPVTGLPIFFLVMYFGLYRLVGVFGAGTVVDFVETHIFDHWLTPLVTYLTKAYLPWLALQELVIGEYGVFTMGIRYAVAIVIPIAAIFFLVFAILEDSGYLPRLALLADVFFKPLGLTGRAIIPITLGLGCGTMAVMVSRILETRRERFLVTLLLALAVPCSAQLGVVMGILSHNRLALLLWGFIIATVFLIAGWAAARVLPGRKGVFYMEVPPLRFPSGRNILLKVFVRLRWYFSEVLPVFIATSVILWLAKKVGVLAAVMTGLEPIASLLGLPGLTIRVFLLGFFRRDYGAAGLYELQKNGLLNDEQLLVVAVVLTLFVPCITQLLITAKERGLLTALALSGAIFPFAFLVGWFLHLVITVLVITI